MNKRKIILIIVLVLSLSLLIVNVSAATKTYSGTCTGGDENHKTTWTKTGPIGKSYEGYVKKNGIYYKKYAKIHEYMIKNCTHKSHAYQLEIWGEDHYSYSTRDVEGYSYVKTKKGDVLKKTNLKYWKTIESKGKVYKYYKYKKTTALSSTKIQTKTITSKKIIAYYKTYNMPSTPRGKFKTSTFKGVKLKYGCSGPSFVDYVVRYVDGSNYGVYKVTSSPKIKSYYNSYTGQYYFPKKPKKFTVYVEKW